MRSWTIALLLILCTGPAVADEVAPAARDRTWVLFGLSTGGTDTGNIDLGGAGFVAQLGRTFGRLQLFGDYQYLALQEDLPYPVLEGRAATYRRMALGARWIWWRAGDGRNALNVMADLGPEVSVGETELHWQDGGDLTRRDLQVGLTTKTLFQVGKREAPRWVGAMLTLRAAFTSPVPGDGPASAVCAGPCDSAAPPPYDLGVYFLFAISYER